MRTFRSKASICLVLGSIVAIFAAPSCLPTDACLRFSDCANGLTCYNGICVIAPAQVDDEAGTDEAGSELDASSPPIDAGTPPIGDATVSDSATDDASDASDDSAADASDD